MGTSLLVQWLRLYSFTAGGTSSPLVRELRSSHAHMVQDKYSKTDGWAGKCQILIKKSRWVAIAMPCSAGPQSCAQKLTSDPTDPESWLLSLCHPPSEPDLLQHPCLLPLQMHYKGQKLAQQMFQGIFFFSCNSRIYLRVPGWTVRVHCLQLWPDLLTLPPWPIYRQHPLKWIPGSRLNHRRNQGKEKRRAKSASDWDLHDSVFTTALTFVLRNMLISPNSRMDSETWGIAESEALWSCKIRCLMGRHTHSPYTKQVILACKPLSQFQTGVLCREQSSRKSPRFVLSPFMGWPLPDILFPPFLCTSFRFVYVLNSPIGWAHVKPLCFEFTNRMNPGWKILGIPPSLCLSTFQFCMANSSLWLLHQQAVTQS